MSDESRYTFLVMTPEDVFQRLSNHASERGDVRIWTKGNDPIWANLLSADKKENIILNIRAEEISAGYVNRQLLLNATVKGVDYFTKGVVLQVEDGKFELALSENVFKLEKRTSERLLAFPHHQIYAYFKFATKDAAEANVVSLNRFKEENKKIYEKFQSLKNQNEIASIEELKEFNPDDLVGFRALDLSLNGVSFLANQNEATFFSDKKKEIDFVILVDGKPYRLNRAKVVYKVDFLNPRAGSVSMFKIGLQFDDNKSFKTDLKGLIESYDNLEELQREFEEYLDRN